MSAAKFGLIASVKYQLPVAQPVTEELKAYSMAIVTTLKDLVKLNPLQSEAIKMFSAGPLLMIRGKLADFVANLTTAMAPNCRRLETFDVRTNGAGPRIVEA